MPSKQEIYIYAYVLILFFRGKEGGTERGGEVGRGRKRKGEGGREEGFCNLSRSSSDKPQDRL